MYNPRTLTRWSLLGLVFAILASTVTIYTAPAAATTGRVVFYTAAHLDQLRQRIAAKTEPTYSAYQKMLSYANGQLDRQPSAPSNWYVPLYYEDPSGQSAAKKPLQDDANTAYQLALVYQMTRDEKYAVTTARLLNGWATTLQTLSKADDSMLTFSYHFPAMIIAADLIKNSPNWPLSQQQQFQKFVREKALPMNTMSRTNNWGNWGLVLVLASAAYLDDSALFDTGVARWKTFIETQIGPNGEMVNEVTRGDGRQGIYYSHFSLTPQTLAAEIMRVNGVDLYNYVAPNGRTLRQAFERIAAWSRNPASFPYYTGDPTTMSNVDYISYFEILNMRWPNADATAMLQQKRPVNTIHVTPRMTFTHGNLALPGVAVAPTATPQPATATPQPATATPQPATATPQPPTATPQPPTATPRPTQPAPTATPQPTQPAPTTNKAIKAITFEGGCLAGSSCATGVTSVSGTGATVATSGLITGSTRSAAINGTAYLQQDFTAADSFFVSLYLKVQARPSAGTVRLIQVQNGTTTVGELYLTSAGVLQLRRGGSTTVIGSSAALSNGTVYRIGLVQKKGTGANGVLQAYVAAGTAAFGAPFGQTTAGSWTTAASRLRFGATNATTSNGLSLNAVFDDVKLDAAAMP